MRDPDYRKRYVDRSRIYWQANKKKLSAARRVREAADPTHKNKVAERSRRYNAANPPSDEDKKRSAANSKRWYYRQLDDPAYVKRRAEYAKRYRSANPLSDEYKKRHRERQRFSKYGLDQDKFDKLVKKRGGTCGICLKVSVRLEVDHCHATEKFRGLLCHNCNVALGSLRDSIPNLKRAISYLEKSKQ